MDKFIPLTRLLGAKGEEVVVEAGEAGRWTWPRRKRSWIRLLVVEVDVGPLVEEEGRFGDQAAVERRWRRGRGGVKIPNMLYIMLKKAITNYAIYSLVDLTGPCSCRD